MTLKNQWTQESLKQLAKYILLATQSDKYIDDINLSSKSTNSSVFLNRKITEAKEEAEKFASDLVAGLTKLEAKIVDAEPTLDNTVSNTMYYYKSNPDSDNYRVYLRLSSELIDMGSTSVELTTIIDNLNSEDATSALSAKMGKTLDEKKLDKFLGVENVGKGLVINEEGYLTIGEAGTKISEEEGNCIEKKDDGIYVGGAWVGTKEEFNALNKSQLKDEQEVIITDDYDNGGLSFPSGDGFYLDEKDGVKGYNTSPNRGADTFFPFNNFNILNYVTHADGTFTDTFEVEKNGRYIVIGNVNADGRTNSTLTISVDGKTPLETKREANAITYADNVKRTNNIHQCSIYDLQQGDVIKCSTYVYGWGGISFTVIGIE